MSRNHITSPMPIDTFIYLHCLSILLVLGKNGKYLGLATIPFVRCKLLSAHEFVECLDPNLEWAVFAGVAFERSEQIRRDVFRFVPVTLVPFLKQANIRAAYLDVKFNVVGKAGIGEVGRTHQAERADDRCAAMGQIGFGVELILAKDAALNFAAADGIDDGRYAFQKIVLGLFVFEA